MDPQDAWDDIPFEGRMQSNGMLEADDGVNDSLDHDSLDNDSKDTDL